LRAALKQSGLRQLRRPYFTLPKVLPVALSIQWTLEQAGHLNCSMRSPLSFSQPAKWRLDVKAGVRATEYDEIIHAALCPKIAFLKNNN
jgi:hypothetical protein